MDGWLLYDFRGENPLARRVLRFPEGAHATRRWLYFIPAHGEPRKLVHRIESGVLDHLPGEKRTYLRWQELEAGVRWLLGAAGGTSVPTRVAMEYAPGVSNPYVSCVDAGTVEFVRSLGVTVVSSGDLIQQFEAALDDEQWAMHLEAARLTDAAYSVAGTSSRKECAAARCDGDRCARRDYGLLSRQRSGDRPWTDRGRGTAQRRSALRADTGDELDDRGGDFVLIDLGRS